MSPTDVFSRFAQEEIVEDGYPVMLVHGRRLATELLAMAYETHAGDVASLIKDLCDGDFATVTHRRPEEILLA
jgi:hypothetical protein